MEPVLICRSPRRSKRLALPSASHRANVPKPRRFGQLGRNGDIRSAWISHGAAWRLDIASRRFRVEPFGSPKRERACSRPRRPRRRAPISTHCEDGTPSSLRSSSGAPQQRPKLRRRRKSSWAEGRMKYSAATRSSAKGTPKSQRQRAEISGLLGELRTFGTDNAALQVGLHDLTRQRDAASASHADAMTQIAAHEARGEENRATIAMLETRIAALSFELADVKRQAEKRRRTRGVENRRTREPPRSEPVTCEEPGGAARQFGGDARRAENGSRRPGRGSLAAARAPCRIGAETRQQRKRARGAFAGVKPSVGESVRTRDRPPTPLGLAPRGKRKADRATGDGGRARERIDDAHSGAHRRPR